MEDKPVVKVDEKQARAWAMGCHLAALVMFVGIPFGNILGPLVIWLIKKNEHGLIDEQGKEALNFQISMAIYGIVAFILVFLVIGWFLLVALAVADVVLIVMAAVKVNNGESFQYPLTLRFIK